jgi:hypothetical protein
MLNTVQSFVIAFSSPLGLKCQKSLQPKITSYNHHTVLHLQGSYATLKNFWNINEYKNLDKAYLNYCSVNECPLNSVKSQIE